MYRALVSRYQDIGITSASKERLILLAYEGAIKFINLAKRSIENGDIHAKCEGISRVVAIIDELAASLNMDEGGEIAEKLSSLYGYMIRRLITANLKSDPEILDEVLSLMKILHSAWVEVIGKPETAMPMETSAAVQHIAA